MSPHTRELQRLYTPARSGCCEQNAETRPPMTDWKLAQKLGHRIPLVNLAWLVCKETRAVAKKHATQTELSITTPMSGVSGSGGVPTAHRPSQAAARASRQRGPRYSERAPGGASPAADRGEAPVSGGPGGCSQIHYTQE
ncbi:unnamed protein product [Prorocentrum cordatum]|uniref:Uncharacterized protein n=1 Tax=Prorocentrum cordatum TaxID=2364126 RepID=A0ABN9UBA9_9DINO|nr:unnamed protein product [Polarella glacialis]